jgi:hypothetical protein
MHAAVDSGCNENAQLMCERSNYGRVLVAAEVMEVWRRSGDGLALGTHAPLAIERRPHVPVCPSVGGNLGELSAGDLPQPDLRGVRGCTSTSRGVIRPRGGANAVAGHWPTSQTDMTFFHSPKATPCGNSTGASYLTAL